MYSQPTLLEAPLVWDVLDNLTYASYRSNRLDNPEVTVERWTKLYGSDTPRMEERFQAECQRYITKFGETARNWQQAMTFTGCDCEVHRRQG